MRIRIREIRMPLSGDESALLSACANCAGVKCSDIASLDIFKCSLDARRGRKPSFVYTVDCEVNVPARFSDNVTAIESEEKLVIPNTKPLSKRPVIVGFGPAGIFCALVLCKSGQKPIILERGKCIEERVKDVENFFATGKLCTSSNVQFGEGGAGTFSDGKLNTLVKDKNSIGRFVLSELCDAGAPREILYRNKPHVGTNNLRIAVTNLRKKLESMGADIYFSHTMTELCIKDGSVYAVKATDKDGKEHIFDTDNVFLALGHSARDTFSMLQKTGIHLERKPFSVGVRIEHKQKLINDIQYSGIEDINSLPPADYKLVCHTKTGRTVYTFCMCPGGEVVAAASEENGVVTNGMSNFARNGENANAALLAEVLPSDFEGADPLAGMYFQRELERKAFKAGGGQYTAPAQTAEDFLNHRESINHGGVTPTYSRGVTYCDLHDVLPDFVTDALHEGLLHFDKVMNGFAAGDAVMTAVESRSSSPVRIVRDKETYQTDIRGIYPIGEGAGYAGGIMSAAIDGIKAAEAMLSVSVESEE